MEQATIKLNQEAIKRAVKAIRNAYSPDKMIMQSVSALNESETMINTEYERLREMYWRYHPEALEMIKDVNHLIRLITKGEKVPSTSMGYPLNNEEVQLMKDYASVINNHLESINVLESFIKKQVKELCPKTSEIANPLIIAKLITIAGSLKRLAMMPASTIQLLGAEKALFRHLTRGARSPKHGIILHHQDVQSARNKGKAARQLANKLSLTIKQDYFGGQK